MGSPSPAMEEGDDHPDAEVSKDKVFKISHFSPGQPRVDPRAAMRPSQAPRTPPKTYKDGGNRKRKREPSLTPGGSKQPEARAKVSKQTPLRGGEGRSRRLKGRRRG